jgi:hypothetical protein
VFSFLFSPKRSLSKGLKTLEPPIAGRPPFAGLAAFAFPGRSVLAHQ